MEWGRLSRLRPPGPLPPIMTAPGCRDKGQRPSPGAGRHRSGRAGRRQRRFYHPYDPSPPDQGPRDPIHDLKLTRAEPRSIGWPAHEVRRYFVSFSHQAQSWKKTRRVVAKVEWHPGELYPRVGFIATDLVRPAERVVASTTSTARRSNGSRKRRARPRGASPAASPSGWTESSRLG